ncbi:MAG: glycosyltransferase family 4 protein [Acidobacteriota bacterium]|nr:glycosyltransferase family 4 protein [Acidobacteriota bacterium]
MARIRILRIIARLNVGGPAIHATLLTERLDPSRYESRLVAGSVEPEEGDYLELHGHALTDLINVPDLGREIRGLSDLRTLWTLIRLIRDFRPHVVHTHTAKAGAVGRLAALICRVPVVVHTFHGHVLRGYFSPVKTRVFMEIERRLGRSSSALIAVSPKVREELLELGIGRPDDFHVVPLGLDLAKFRDFTLSRPAARAQLGLPDNAFVTSIVARLVPIKAHEVFLEAARRLLAVRPDAVFLIVGDGERREELEAMAASLGLGESVRFLGWRADLQILYRASDAVALTSRNEGSPVALIEAMAAGCPVVSTRVGGVPDVVTDQESGLLAEMDDPAALAEALGRVASNRALGLALGETGRERVLARYGADRLLDDVDALYVRLLRRAGLTT